jgi:serine/threonine protein kinase
MARVYLGKSPGHRDVAVKVILRYLADDPVFIDAFRREVANAQKVNGAYTPSVVKAGPDDDPPWLATLYVRGPSLAEAVSKQPFPETAIWRLAGGLVEALEDIHEHLVHRDLTPRNVLLDPDGPKVIDFGISAARDELLTTAGHRGLTGIGTPAYMSPEQAKGEKVESPSDVFSLGSVIAFAANGQDLFGTGTWYAIVNRVINDQPDLSHIPGSLREIVANCLEKNPNNRPSLRELLDKITPRLAEEPGEALASFWPVPLATLIKDRYDLTDPSPAPDRYPPEQGGQHGSPGGPVGESEASPPAGADTDVNTVDLGGTVETQPGPSKPAPPEPPQPNPPGPISTPEPSRIRLGVIAGAAALVLAGLVTGVTLLVQGGAHQQEPAFALTDMPSQRYGDGLLVHTRWTLGGEGGSSLTDRIVAINTTDVPLTVYLREPVPKAIVTRLGAAIFTPSAPMIIRGPGLVWKIRVAAHHRHAVKYTVTISPLGASTARLKGLVSHFSSVKPGVVPQPRQPLRLMSLTIMPPSLHIAPGHSIRLTLIGRLSNGKRATGAYLSKLVWKSTDRLVATVSSVGKLTAIAAGHARICQSRSY